ncbi:MAG TPA: hypothetical protein VMN77_00075 [Nitrospiria bacterium]|jgi:hypothetical protein|nr:hypothetical protein [Nitrospiria bacterium]
MLTQKTQIRRTALLLVLVYLFLSGFMTIGAVQHDFNHGHNADHAKQHASPACDWMCTASAFIHSADPNLTQGFNSSFESKIVYRERVFASLSIFSLYIRPPPHPLS